MKKKIQKFISGANGEKKSNKKKCQAGKKF